MTRNPLVRSVSAFFPCYNDERSIALMVGDVRRSLVEAVDDFEIIVIDDGSTDSSFEVLTALASQVPELRVIRHEANRGYGGALLSGFAASTKEWIFYTDGDAQYDASEITRCIDAVTVDVDVVQGWKMGRGDPWYRKLIGRTYHHVVKILFRLPVRDTDCDFRLIHSRVMEQVELTSTSGVICVEMMHAFDRDRCALRRGRRQPSPAPVRAIAVFPHPSHRPLGEAADGAVVAGFDQEATRRAPSDAE